MTDIAPLFAALRLRFGVADNAPDGRLLHALLLDHEIRTLLERKAFPKSRQKPQSASRHPPEALNELAQAFDAYAAQAREAAAQRELGKPTIQELRQGFLENFRDRFPWLTKTTGEPMSCETLARLRYAGRKYAALRGNSEEKSGEVRLCGVSPGQS